MRKNLGKLRLRDGKAILGVHVPFPAPAVVRFAAAGPHWVLIDCEHAPMKHAAALPRLDREIGERL
jgi:2-keto-3-deoxy-L-rhamnonate aldolase RhmA